MHLRTERAGENAKAIAEMLAAHPAIASVNYIRFKPEGSPARLAFERQCRGGGSTFSFRIKGDEAAVFRFLDALKILKMAVSLGGTETLICHPATTTHYAVARERREALGIDESTLRISVGIEHIDDLIADLRSRAGGDLMGPVDPTALDGKLPPPEAHVQVLVVGGGPAGLAAATALASQGHSVMLVDENPLDPQLIGVDVPLFFGGRAGSGGVHNQARMIEQIAASDPAIEAAFEAGVDVALGVTCWGLYLPGKASRALPSPLAALTDGNRSWTVGFDRILVATGARDFVAFFDGADQPGVMGAQAFAALADRYEAFDGRRLVIVGSGPLGAATARRALDLGLEVAALVDVTDEPPRGKGRD